MISPLHCKILASLAEIPDQFYGLPMRQQVKPPLLTEALNFLLLGLDLEASEEQ